MKTKLFSLFLALVASVGNLFAVSDTCGENLTWYLTNEELVILGTGDMTDFKPGGAPWYIYRSGIKSVTIENSVTSIGQDAFFGCYKVTSVIIPNSVTNIGNAAFSGCTSLTSITIPNSVTNIGSDAFSSCSRLTSVIIPNSVTSIGQSAFNGCYSLTSVTIPNSVTSIGESSFAGCSGLTSVTIPNSVTSIGESSFADCSGLTSVTIPNSVTSIGQSAFNGCYSLTSVTIPRSVTNIRPFTFESCRSLNSVTIPNGVTSIGEMAFEGCYGLTCITIPNSVIFFGSGAFHDCYGLTSIVVEDGNPVYDSRKKCNAIIETASHTLITGCKNTIIPNSVTSINGGAFYGCKRLMSITIPNSVTSIGNAAFYDCTKLTNITIPNSVTSIGDYAFAGCEGLTSITNYATTPQSISSSVFEYGGWSAGVDKSTCTLYVPKESKDLYRTAYVWKDFIRNIQAISAVDTETTGTKVTPDSTFADITWPQVNGAYTYKLVVRDKDGNIVCMLVFDSQGQLTSFYFNVPARDHKVQQSQTTGFVFTVTGLEKAATYSYSIIAYDYLGNVLKEDNGIFTTQKQYLITFLDEDNTVLCSQNWSYGTIPSCVKPTKEDDDEYTYTFNGWTPDVVPVVADATYTAAYIATPKTEGLEDANETAGKPSKVVKDGQIFVLRGDKTYTVTGQEVR